jgi:hypothetical protein
MRRIFRDNWAWRGGLALDELRYAPDPEALGRVVAGPGPADGEGWPFLVSVTDTVALQCAREAPGTATTAAAAAVALLSERADGLLGRIPGAVPALAPAHAALVDAAGRTGVVDDFATALCRLEEVGVLRRDGDDVVLLRPPDPRPDDLLACRRHMDEVAGRPENHELDRLLTRLVRRVERDGAPARRFHGLADAGRLRIVVAASPASENPDGLFDVGPHSLPSLDLVMHPHGRPHALRGWIGAGGMRLEDDPGSGGPILLAAYEVAAGLLGGGVGPNALRRATRAAGLWLLLIDATEARTGALDTSVSSVAGRLGAALGLAPGGDHRALATMLLEDLERAGIIATERPTRKTLRVVLRHPPPPTNDRVRHFVRGWSAWLLAGGGDRADELGGVLHLAREHLRRTRARWERLLEARLVRVEVLSGPGAPTARDPGAARPPATAAPPATARHDGGLG